MKRLLAVLAFSTLALTPLYGADIYRWVDDQGRVHFSDDVPEQFRKSATRIDPRQYELTPEQRKEAEARAAQERVRAAQAAERDAKAKAAQAAKAASAASAARAKAPAKLAASAPTAPSAGDCTTLRRRFQESSDCFAPFVNANGSIKEQAFEACGPPVPFPARECSSTPAY